MSLKGRPDLPVMDGGGILQIQIDSLSAEAVLQLSQSTALLAAVGLQDTTIISKNKLKQKKLLPI